MSTIYSIPQRIIYTLAIDICRYQVKFNEIIFGDLWDVVIPKLFIAFDVKMNLSDDENDVASWEVKERENFDGKKWLTVKIDGCLVIERDPSTIKKISKLMEMRLLDLGDELEDELEEDLAIFEWNDYEDIPSLKTKDLLLPPTSDRS